MKENKTIKSLPVRLSIEEFETKSKDLAVLCQEIVHEKTKASQAAKTAKDQIDVMESYRSKLSHIVKDKEEYRDVECVDRYDYIRRQVVTVRTDTGEEVGHRGMEIHEFQEEMDLHGNPAAISKDEKTVGFRKTAKA